MYLKIQVILWCNHMASDYYSNNYLHFDVFFFLQQLWKSCARRWEVLLKMPLWVWSQEHDSHQGININMVTGDVCLNILMNLTFLRKTQSSHYWVIIVFEFLDTFVLSNFCQLNLNLIFLFNAANISFLDFFTLFSPSSDLYPA